MDDEMTGEVARITITKVFDDDAVGGTAVCYQLSEGLGLADALGMLTMVEHFVVRDAMCDDDAS